MSDDDRLKNIEKLLDTHGVCLKEIQDMLSERKVQDERIANAQTQLNAVWKKYDALCGPEGTLARISYFQANCPRNQIKWIWITLVPMGFTIITIGIAILSKVLP